MTWCKKRIAITGIGIISANGNSVEEYWSNVVAGNSGIKIVTTIDMSQISTKYGGEVSNFDPKRYFNEQEMEMMDRAGQFAVIAAREAVKTSGLTLDNVDPYRMGIVLGTSLGGMRSGEVFHEQWIKQGLENADLRLILRYPIHTPCDNVAHDLGIKGPKSVISNACAAGTSAIGYAVELIRSGKSDVMLAGGVDPLTLLSFSGFNCLQALSPNACSPYSKSDGLNIGEGAGFLVLEAMDDAIARGANIWAEVLDYELSADAYHVTAPDPGGAGAIRSMRGSLEKAGMTEADITYINGHGTGTPTNDASEPKALRHIVQNLSIPISSTKSSLGHMLGAAGAAEAVTCVLAIRNQFIPPTVNFDESQKKFDLDFVPNQGRSADLDVVMSNSFAFGGNNATILFGKASNRGPEKTINRKRVVLTGTGVLAGNAPNLEQFEKLLEGGQSGISAITQFDTTPYGSYDAGIIPPVQYNKMINPSLLRKMDTLSKQAVAATKMALDHAKLKVARSNSEKIGVIFATGTGPIETVEGFNRVVIEQGVKMANAMLFPNTVMNAAAGHICLNFNIKGPTTTITAGGVSAINALYYAYSLIQLGNVNTYIVVTSDEFHEALLAGHKRLQNFLTPSVIRPFAADRDGVVLGSGTTAFIVESEEAALARGAEILAEIKGFGLTSDSYRISSINPRGDEWKKSYELALLDAGIEPGQVGYLAAAANGHRLFDAVEARAIHNVFGTACPVSAPNSYFGDAHGTAGGIGLLTALYAMKGQLPATLNVERTMENAGFDHIIGNPRIADVDHALVSSYAYGGNYNSVVIGKYKG